MFVCLQHGESEYNVVGRIGGDTDLSPRGRKYASTLARFINDAQIPELHVWTSEKRRTKQTAAGITAPSEPIAALNELDAVSLPRMLSSFLNLVLPSNESNFRISKLLSLSFENWIKLNIFLFIN